MPVLAALFQRPHLLKHELVLQSLTLYQMSNL